MGYKVILIDTATNKIANVSLASPVDNATENLTSVTNQLNALMASLRDVGLLDVNASSSSSSSYVENWSTSSKSSSSSESSFPP